MFASTFDQRLKELQGEESARSFARRIGISDGAIRALMTGGRPTLDTLLAIADKTGVELKWLATGEGPKYPPSREAETSSRNGSNGVLVPDTVDIPRLDIRASAGAGAVGSLGEVLEFMPFPIAWLRARGLNPAMMRIVDVAGDSMEPTLSDGDIILVDTSTKRIRGDALYVLVRDEELFVKRAQQRMNGSVLISSDNERYPPEEITPDAAPRLQVAGRVVWFGRSI